MITSFKKRNKNKIAEHKAEESLYKRNIRYIRYGLDYLDSDLPIYNIPSLIRSAPDLIIFNRANESLFYEIKGYVDFVKLKLEDIKNYDKWNNHMEILFFLYNIKEDNYIEITYNKIKEIIHFINPTIKAYPESPDNKYYEIPRAELPHEHIL